MVFSQDQIVFLWSFNGCDILTEVFVSDITKAEKILPAQSWGVCMRGYSGHHQLYPSQAALWAYIAQEVERHRDTPIFSVRVISDIIQFLQSKAYT